VVITKENRVRTTRDDLRDVDRVIGELLASAFAIGRSVQDTSESQLDTDTNLSDSDRHCFNDVLLGKTMRKGMKNNGMQAIPL